MLVPRRLFVPTPVEVTLIVALGMAGAFWGIYFRYMIVEPSTVGLACEGGLATATCTVRKAVIALFTNTVFGYVAIGAALLALIRPLAPLMAIALMAGGAGLSLYNTATSALAIALVILVLARRELQKETD